MEKTSNVFQKIVSDINSSNNEYAPRWLKVRELINYKATIENTLNLAFDFEKRKISWKYLAAELLWYLSCDLSAENIWKYASMWKDISDEKWEVNSNYWFIVFLKSYKDYVNQYNFVLTSLKNDRDSRQAVIRYNSEEHIYKWNKDMVCTLSNQFIIRDNKLHLIVNMRSNDMFYWFQYDLVRFWLLLQSLKLDLETTYEWLELWRIYHNVGSAHIYEKMFKTAEDVIDDKNAKDYNIELLKPMSEISDRVRRDEEFMRKDLESCTDYKKFIEDNFFIKITN